MVQRDVRHAALVALLIGLGTVVASLLLASFSDASGFTNGREVAPFPREFRTGDYINILTTSPAQQSASRVAGRRPRQSQGT